MSDTATAQKPAQMATGGAPAGRASTILTSAVLAASLCLLLTGQRILGDEGLGPVITYAGLGLLLAALGLRAAAFVSASGDVRAVEARLLGAYVGVAVAVGIYFLTTGAGLEALGVAGDPVSRLPGILSTLWMATLLVSLFAVLFIELVYLRMPIPESVELRRVRTALHAGLSLALSMVFLLAINYVATVRDVRKDVSYFKTTKPSAGTLAMLDKLEKPVRAVLLFEPSSDVLGQVEPYFATLAKQSDKFEYETVDVALAPELAREHRVRDNGHVLLIEPDQDDAQGDEKSGEKDDPHQQVTARTAPKGELFRIGNTLTEARRGLKKLDGTFQESFRSLVRPERALYLTVGHGERNAKSSELPAADGTSLLGEILKRLNLKTEDLGLAQGLGTAVPDGANAVAIIGPSERFMPEEAEVLLQYVRKGGRLLLMVDPDQELGLEPLYAGLGIEVLPGTVVSDKNHMRRAFNQSDRAIVFSNRYTAHPSVTTASRHSREVATVFYHGVALGQAQQGAKPAPRVTYPLRSESGFWRDLNGNFTRDPDEKEEVLNLMAAVTLPVEGGGGSDEGRVVVIGDGDFMTNKLAGNNGNMLVFVDSLAWLIGNEELSGEVASEEDIPIEHSREQDKVWFYLTTFAVPVPVLLLGLWVSRRRSRRAGGRS